MPKREQQPQQPRLVFNPSKESLFARFFNQYVIIGTDIGMIQGLLVDTAQSIIHFPTTLILLQRKQKVIVRTWHFIAVKE